MWRLFRRDRAPDMEENEKRQLQLLVNQISDQNRQLHNMLTQTQTEYLELETLIRDFCKMLLQRRFAMQKLSGEIPGQMPILEFIAYTKQQYAQMQMEDQAKNMQLLRTVEDQRQQIRDLQEQIAHLLVREQQRLPVSFTPEDRVETEKEGEQTSTKVGFAEKREISQPKLVQETLKQDSDVFESGLGVETGVEQPVVSQSVLPENVPTPTVIVSSVESLAHRSSSDSSSQSPVVEMKPVKVAHPHQPARDREKKRRQKGAVVQPVIIQDTSFPAVAPVTTPIQSSGEEEAQDQPIAHVVDLALVIGRLNEQDWVVIRGIGEQGFSLVKDLNDFARSNGMTDTVFQRSLRKIRDAGIVEEEKITVGSTWFLAFSLSDVGRRVYIKKTGRNPVLSEREQMIRDHTTAVHGYGIREVAGIMKEREGVKTVTMDRKTNRIVLPISHKEYIPDVIVTFETGEQLFMEYELGHHTQADFDEKCARLAELSPDLVFVVPDQERMQIVRSQLERWLEKRENEMGPQALKNVSIHLTTLSKLKDGIWEYEWPPHEKSNQ